MPIIPPESLLGIKRPELFFGVVAAVGTPLEGLFAELTGELEQRQYRVETVHLSEFTEAFDLEAPLPSGKSEFERISCMMDRGNELREKGGEALVLVAAGDISSRRPDQEPRHMSGRAVLFRQLKHPDEAVWFRRIYGPGFHLIGLYCPLAQRRQYLYSKGLSPNDADQLIERDEGEPTKWGQQLRRTFHMADVFIEIPSLDDLENTDGVAAAQLRRFFSLLFDSEITSPTVEEYGMSLARTAALRSSDLSRQVGAAILSPTREVLAVGTNEVPAYGGGQYWPDSNPDERDYRKGYDSNERERLNVLEEVLSTLLPDWEQLGADERTAQVRQHAKSFDSARIMNLTEFGRAVHAEMEAILAAARLGIPLRGATLYTTTFPCHNCAKHIVGAGIKRVVYVEPYPKSMARELHDDAISFPEDEATDDNSSKVVFKPFVGVAPRRYGVVFSRRTAYGERRKRKDSISGNLIEGELGLRLTASPLSYIQREEMAADAVSELINPRGGI